MISSFLMVIKNRFYAITLKLLFMLNLNELFKALPEDFEFPEELKNRRTRGYGSPGKSNGSRSLSFFK